MIQGFRHGGAYGPGAGMGRLRGQFQQRALQQQQPQQMQRLQQMQPSDFNPQQLEQQIPQTMVGISPIQKLKQLEGERISGFVPSRTDDIPRQRFVEPQITGFPVPQPPTSSDYGVPQAGPQVGVIAPGFAKPISSSPSAGGGDGAGGPPTSWKMSIEPMAYGGMVPGYQTGGMHSDTLSTVARQPFLNRPEYTFPNEMMAWKEGRSPMRDPDFLKLLPGGNDDSRSAAYLQALEAVREAEDRGSPANIYTSFSSREPADFSGWRQDYEDPDTNEFVTKLWYMINKANEPEGRASGGIIGLAGGGYIPMYAGGRIPGYWGGGFLRGLGKVISKAAPLAMNFIPGASGLSGLAKAGIGALAQGAGDLASDKGLNVQSMLGGAGRSYALSSALDRMRNIEGLEDESLWGSLGKVLTDKDIGKEAMGALADIPFGEAQALAVTEAAAQRGAQQQAQDAGGFGGVGMVNPMGSTGRVMPGSVGVDPASGYASQMTYGQQPIDYTRSDGGLIPGYRRGGAYEEEDEYGQPGYTRTVGTAGSERSEGEPTSRRRRRTTGRRKPSRKRQREVREAIQPVVPKTMAAGAGGVGVVPGDYEGEEYGEPEYAGTVGTVGSERVSPIPVETDEPVAQQIAPYVPRTQAPATPVPPSGAGGVGVVPGDYEGEEYGEPEYTGRTGTSGSRRAPPPLRGEDEIEKPVAPPSVVAPPVTTPAPFVPQNIPGDMTEPVAQQIAPFVPRTQVPITPAPTLGAGGVGVVPGDYEGDEFGEPEPARTGTSGSRRAAPPPVEGDEPVAQQIAPFVPRTPIPEQPAVFDPTQVDVVNRQQELAAQQRQAALTGQPTAQPFIPSVPDEPGNGATEGPDQFEPSRTGQPTAPTKRVNEPRPDEQALDDLDQTMFAPADESGAEGIATGFGDFSDVPPPTFTPDTGRPTKVIEPPEGVSVFDPNKVVKKDEEATTTALENMLKMDPDNEDARKRLERKYEKQNEAAAREVEKTGVPTGPMRAAVPTPTTTAPPPPLATRAGSGAGSGFYGEQKWFDPNAAAPAERDIGGFSPHELPRTAADFAAAGDTGGAGLLDRLNAPAAPVQNYLSPAPVPGAAEGGLISQVPMEDLEKLARAAQQIESPGSQQIIEQAIDDYGLELVQQIIKAIQEQGAMTAPDGAVPGSGMARGGLINGGGGDAMADDILVNAEMGSNGERQPIAVSAGEYIVPGDVLAHLGSGNTSEGGEVMDQFVEDVRVQRTGSPQQPPPIDLRDVLPGTYGGRYA